MCEEDDSGSHRFRLRTFQIYHVDEWTQNLHGMEQMLKCPTVVTAINRIQQISSRIGLECVS